MKDRVEDSAIARIYDRLCSEHDVVLNRSVEDCLHYTNDWITFHEPGETWCTALYRDLLRLHLYNLDRASRFYDPMYIGDPVIRNGERQFEVKWNHTKWRRFYAFPDGELDLVEEFIPILAIFIEELDPFLGIFGEDYQWWACEDFEEDVAPGFECFKSMMMSKHGQSERTSLYLDHDMFRAIGSDPIQEWAAVRIPVGDLGMFIERDKDILKSRQVRDDDYLSRKKGIYMDHIYPVLCERVGREFGYI